MGFAMASSRTRLKQRAALVVLCLVVFGLCLAVAFVYGTSFAPPAARANVTVVEVAANKPPPPAPEPTPLPPQPATAPELSEAAKLALKREGYRNRLEKLGVKTPEFLWFQSERILIWAQVPESEQHTSEKRWYAETMRSVATPAAIEEWLTAYEAEYGECNAGREGEAPLTAILFRNSYAFRRWVWDNDRYTVPIWAGGLYHTKRDVSLVPADGYWVRILEVLRHETFHAFQFRCAPSCSDHSWFVEGSASWVERADIRNGKLQRGDWEIRAYYGYFRYLLRCGVTLDIRRLMKLSPQEFYADPMVNYLASYLLVDYILDRSDLRPVYFEYWKLMRAGKSADAAFEATFGKLDLEALNKRFLQRVRSSPVNYQMPRMTRDAATAAAPNAALPMPQLSEETDDDPPDEALEKLKGAGFDVERDYPIDGAVEKIVICIDSSKPSGIEGMDLSKFGRWLGCCSYSTEMYLRPEAYGLPTDPPFSLRVLYILVQSVLDGKEAAFSSATGFKPDAELVEHIRTWASGAIEFKSIRECYQAAVRAYAGPALNGRPAVTLLDFRSDIVRCSGAAGELASVEMMFDRLQTERERTKAAGSDTSDWSKALLEACALAGEKRTAVLFFTNSAPSGAQTGDSSALCADVLNAWKRSGATKHTKLILIGAPGAQHETLGDLAKLIPASRRDDWVARFGK